jgi:hypothetical protein
MMAGENHWVHLGLLLLDDNPAKATTEPHGSVVAFHMPLASMAREPPLPNCGLDYIAQRPVGG